MPLSPAILPWQGHVPRIDPTAFIAPTAAIVGDVVVGPESSVWFGCTLRGDVHAVRIGARVNIQDGSVVHVTQGTFGTTIGDDVVVGHGCIIHACTLESGSFVGMGATLLDGSVVESGAMIAAGALLPPGKRVPHGELWAGSPAKKMRALSDQEIEDFIRHCRRYADLARQYRERLHASPT